MGVRIGVDGIDKLIRELDEMQDGLKAETIAFWCKRVLNDVKMRAASEKAEEIVMDTIPTADGNFQIRFSSPPQFVGMIKDSVAGYLPQMPITTQAFFEKFVEVLDEKSKEDA